MTATVVSGLSFFIARSNLYQVVFHFLLMVVWAKIAENMLTGKTVDIKKQKEGQALAALLFYGFNQYQRGSPASIPLSCIVKSCSAGFRNSWVEDNSSCVVGSKALLVSTKSLVK